jgi:hypothetical protein
MELLQGEYEDQHVALETKKSIGPDSPTHVAGSPVNGGGGKIRQIGSAEEARRAAEAKK